MNDELNTRLETEIDRELKALPQLSAPVTLTPRVMAAIAARAAVAWYRQSWQLWPAPLRVCSLVLAILFVATVSVALWHLPRTTLFAAVTHEVDSSFGWVGTLWNALGALGATVTLLVKQVGLPIWIGCAVAIAFAWVTCVGVGTVWVRLALARR